MLKLVTALPPAVHSLDSSLDPSLDRSRAAKHSLQLHQVALLQLEPEFARYLTRHLRATWPAVKILLPQPFAAIQAEQCQLIICAMAPTFAPVIPTLWLSEIARSTALLQISPNLWKTPTPITGRELIRTIACLLASTGKDAA